MNMQEIGQTGVQASRVALGVMRFAGLSPADATASIAAALEAGIDFFDCVYPSRNGRHGHVYTNRGKLNLLNAKYELDDRPIQEGCGCPACRRYSRAYLRHLLKAKEMLGMRLCVLHNLYFYNHLMEEIRDALDQGRFASYKKEKLAGFEAKEA